MTEIVKSKPRKWHSKKSVSRQTKATIQLISSFKRNSSWNYLLSSNSFKLLQGNSVRRRRHLGTNWRRWGEDQSFYTSRIRWTWIFLWYEDAKGKLYSSWEDSKISITFATFFGLLVSLLCLLWFSWLGCRQEELVFQFMRWGTFFSHNADYASSRWSLYPEVAWASFKKHNA